MIVGSKGGGAGTPVVGAVFGVVVGLEVGLKDVLEMPRGIFNEETEAHFHEVGNFVLSHLNDGAAVGIDPAGGVGRVADKLNDKVIVFSPTMDVGHVEAEVGVFDGLLALALLNVGGVAKAVTGVPELFQAMCDAHEAGIFDNIAGFVC